MTWLSLIVTLLSITRSIIDWLDSRKMIQEGQREIIAQELAKVSASAKISQDILQKVSGMTDAQVDKQLEMDFRPGTDGAAKP